MVQIRAPPPLRGKTLWRLTLQGYFYVTKPQPPATFLQEYSIKPESGRGEGLLKMSTQTPQRLLWGAGVLSLTLWVLVPSSYGSSQFWSVALILGLGGIALWLKVLPHFQSTPSTADTEAPSREKVQRIFSQIETKLAHLGDIPSTETTVTHLEDKLSQLATDLDRSKLQFTLLGGAAVGKSTLQTVLQTQELPLSTVTSHFTEASLELLQDSDLTAQEQDLDALISPTQFLPEPLASADVVLFIIQGDLTNSEYQALQRLQSNRKRVLLILNKQDQYLPTQRIVLRQKLQQRLHPWLKGSDILAIAAQPQVLKVRRHQEDGTWEEFLETAPTPSRGTSSAADTDCVTGIRSS